MAITVNGQRYAMANVTVNVTGIEMVDVQSIDYRSRFPTEDVHGRGDLPAGYTEQPYTAEGSMKLLRDEAQKLMAALALSGDGTVRGHTPIPIIVQYGNDTLGLTTDVLKVVKFQEAGIGMSRGDKAEVELPFKIHGGIIWGGIPDA